MADQGSPAASGGGGFTPINRSPGNDSMSSGLPVHDDKKRRSDAQVAAVVTHDRTKASPEPRRDLVVSSSSDAGSHRTSCGVCVWSVVGSWLVVVVGRSSGRTSTQRHPLMLNLKGLVLRCCSTVPLSTVEAQSDSSELQEVFLSRLQVISRKVYGLTTQWLIKVRQLSLEQDALARLTGARGTTCPRRQEAQVRCSGCRGGHVRPSKGKS